MMGSLREPLGCPIRADVRDVASLGHFHSICIGGSRFYCRYKVCAGRSRRNQICLCCHSHFNSASSEGMGPKGCSVSRKGGEETNVNKNRPRCQSVSDDFGYPVLKVSKHIEFLPWEESQRRLSSSWESSRVMDANHSQSVPTGRVERYLS